MNKDIGIIKRVLSISVLFQCIAHLKQNAETIPWQSHKFSIDEDDENDRYTKTMKSMNTFRWLSTTMMTTTV